MNKIIRFGVLILVLSVLVTVLFSCDSGEPSENIAVTEAAGSNGTADTETPALEDLFPYLEYNFEGAVLTFLARQDDWGGGAQNFEDLRVEELTGEVLNDAVYHRNSIVESRFNVEIQVTYAD